MKLKKTDKVYQFFTYDVWGNARDGYEVNDVQACGTYIVISNTAPNNAIERAIMRAVFKPGRKPKYTIDWIDDTMIEIERARDGRPIGRFIQRIYTEYDLRSRWGFPSPSLAQVYYISPRGRVIDATGRY